MTIRPPPLPPLQFGDFVLDSAQAELRRAGAKIELAPMALALLAHLAARPGELVSKDLLLDAVWGRRFVSEGAVKTVVSELRAALGDDARSPRWVQTVHGRGYRFVGEVVPVHPPQGGAAGAGNVPAGLPALIGRELELASLAERLQGHRLVTLAGSGGVGKTSLALAAADALRARFAHGCWFVPLTPLDAHADVQMIRSTLVQTLHLAAAATESDAALAQALQGFQALLVLDNAEHLLDVLAPLVSELHRQLPALRLLVTSREPLRVADEQVLRLNPLALPGADDDADASRLMACGAVRLFVTRVAARLPGFALGADNQHAVAALCRSLDGLPLVLELAAARVPALGVHGLAERLSLDMDEQPIQHLQLLSQGARSAAPQQRSLRAALDWSHALLTPAQQQVFRQVAVFRGGFTLESAQRLCVDDTLDAWAVLDAVNALVEKSMLVASVPAVQPQAVRFHLLESLRAYALERLAAAGDQVAMQRRHLQGCLAHWARADERALSDPALDWVERHAPEIDNLRAALGWGAQAAVAGGDPGVVSEWLALVGHAGPAWHRAGLVAEGVRWCEAAMPLAAAQPDMRLSAGVDLALATLSAYAGARPPAEGLALALRAAEAFERSGDAVREYFARYLVCVLMVRLPQRGDRASQLARMQTLEQPGWGDLLTRYRRAAAAYEDRLAGRHEAFLHHARAELALTQAAGAQWESWTAAHALMLAEHGAGHPDAALAVGRQMVADIRAAGRLRQNGQRLMLWALMLAHSGDTPGMRAALEDAVPVAQSTGLLADLHVSLAWLAWHEDRHADAARLLAWFDSPGGGGGVYGPGTYPRRTVQELEAHLAQRLDAQTLLGLRTEGSRLGAAAALRMGLAH